MLDFFNAAMEQATWIRVAEVVIGALLVYHALMWAPNRFISSIT